MPRKVVQDSSMDTFGVRLKGVSEQPYLVEDVPVISGWLELDDF